ncbi:MAG: fibronectin type III domain-containing protein [Cyanobacteria bacterium SBLK]|nr:fibronectin type III domain-containing protein [Cyanobacteria bacterium SBLK]
MPVPTIPAAPELFTDSTTSAEQSRGSDRLRLTWTLSSEVDAYDIRFVNTAVDTIEIRANVNPNASFGGLTENTLYQVSIRAINNEGASSFSTALDVRTRPPRPTTAPELLSTATLPSGEISSRGPNFLFLAFDSVGSQYKYDFRLNSGEVRLNSGFKIEGLQPNNRYEIEVRARDESTDNESFWSPSFVTITRPSTPPVLDLPFASSITFSLVVQWDIAGTSRDFIQLKQVIGSTEEILVSRGSLKGSHEIRNTNSGIEVNYSIRLVIPSSLVAGGLNRSFWSSKITFNLSYPLVLHDMTEATKYSSLGTQNRGYSQRNSLR